MRHTFLIMVVAALGGGFALASCGGSGKSNGDGGTGDMATAAAPDMVIAKLNCEGVGTCIYNCLVGGLDLGSCATQCNKQAKPGSYNKWANAFTCGEDYCKGNNDMMAPECVEQMIATDMGTEDLLCDPAESQANCLSGNSTVCLPCLDNARNYWFIEDSTSGPPTFDCADTTSPDCTGAKTACKTSFQACLSDM